MQSVHLENSSGDQSTKRITQLLSDEQGGVPFPELFLGVPIGLSDSCTRSRGGLTMPRGSTRRRGRRPPQMRLGDVSMERYIWKK
jgi:hypothetical protein